MMGGDVHRVYDVVDDPCRMIIWYEISYLFWDEHLLLLVISLKLDVFIHPHLLLCIPK